MASEAALNWLQPAEKCEHLHPHHHAATTWVMKPAFQLGLASDVVRGLCPVQERIIIVKSSNQGCFVSRLELVDSEAP